MCQCSTFHFIHVLTVLTLKSNQSIFLLCGIWISNCQKEAKEQNVTKWTRGNHSFGSSVEILAKFPTESNHHYTGTGFDQTEPDQICFKTIMRMCVHFINLSKTGHLNALESTHFMGIYLGKSFICPVYWYNFSQRKTVLLFSQTNTWYPSLGDTSWRYNISIATSLTSQQWVLLWCMVWSKGL